ncbi:MAG: transporter substrate-binding domain-containing protein [Candidatus Fermentibacteraceae bacterium]
MTAIIFFPRNGAGLTELTPEERAWLDANIDSLFLYFNTDFPPIEFISSEGDFVGLGADVIAAVEERLGVTFPRKPCADWNRHLEALASGECAIAPTIVRTPEREEFAFFSRPYSRVPVVIISTRSKQSFPSLDDLAGLDVAVVSGYATEQYVRSLNRGRYEVIPLWNVPEGLRAVSFGEVDVFVENLAVAAYYTDLEGLSNLRVSGTTDFYFEWSIGVSREYPLLYSAVRKALADIPRKELESMQRGWISMETHQGLSPEAMRTLGLTALFVGALLVGLALITLLLKRRLNEKVRSLETAQRELLAQSQRLQHAEKMEALGTLAGGISHDFNNILQIISGYAQLMIARNTGDRSGSTELAQILGASRRAAALINQLLAFSRKMDIRKVPLDLNREITNAARILEQTIPKMIGIRLALEPSLRVVEADPVQIEQILLNLAANAVDAMPDGGSLQFASANAVLDEAMCRELGDVTPGEFVVFSVTDSGQGIPGEIIDKIFNPFFTTKESGKGTGLGLSSAYGIVKNHDGCIRCRNEAGLGTTFEVFIPASPEQGEPDAGDENHPGVVPGRGETILVIDDEALILEQSREFLTMSGYRVLTAESGEDALEVFEENSGTDLVLLDLNMPGMGGYRCLSELLKLSPDLKVLIVSGHSAFGQYGENLTRGARGFLSKPYRMAELAARIREVLDEGLNTVEGTT